MKITNYLSTTAGAVLSLLILFSSISSHGQTLSLAVAPPPPVVSPGQIGEQVSLKTALNRIKQQHQVQFGYDEELIRNKQASASVSPDQPLEDQLRDLLGPLGLEYKKLDERHYVIRVREKDTRAVPKLRGQSISTEASLGQASNPPLSARGAQAGSILRQTYEKTITGTVTDQSAGDGLPGVNIVAKGTSVGTVTDIDGNYRLSVPDETQILVFSSVGYVSEEVAINNQTVVNVALAPDVKSLSEVVVVGYGTQRKSDLTGSVSSVPSEELTAYPATDAVQALQGRAAGVQIQASNGEPGADLRVRVRGGTSINASSDPLYVVDGFVSGVLPPPEDIASIEVLKDASATAIYGSRGANGVILISTKKGKAGDMRVNFNASYSVQNPVSELDLLNAPQYAALQNELRGSDNPFAGGNQNIVWLDEVLQTGNIQNYQMSFSGGSEKVRYYLSGVYFGQNGIIQDSQFKRYSLTGNVEADLNERFIVGLNLVGRRSVQDGVLTQEATGDANGTGVIMGSYLFDPTLGIFNANGNYTTVPPRDNPVASLVGRTNENLSDRVQTNVFGELKISEGLTLRSTWGAAIINDRDGRFTDAFLIPTGGQAIAGIFTNKVTNLLNENYLNYVQDFGKHGLSATAGYSFQSFETERFGAEVQNFTNNSVSFRNLGAANNLRNISSSLVDSRVVSFYARLNYSFDDRFIATFTNRYDGSSVLSPGNKWKYFPSGAIAWNIGNEGFLESIGLVDDLKLRASYGFTGNQTIDPYSTLARFSNYNAVLGNQLLVGLQPSDVANATLTWETTEQLDVGVDLGLWESRLTVTADYYDMLTRDLLFSRELPSYSGYGSQTQNIGQVSNRGFEVSLSSRNLVNEFKWNTSFNLSANRIRVEKLPIADQDIFFDGRPGQLVDVSNNIILREGETVGAFYGYVYDGVIQSENEILEGGDQEVGGAKFLDLDGDGILDPENDRRVIGNPNPDFIWGLNNDFSYRGFDLNIFFQAVMGNDIFNITRMELETLGQTDKNSTTNALNRWTSSNTGSDFPKALPGRPYRMSTRWIEDGSFVRLKNISLGYTLPAPLLEDVNLRSVRVYVSAQNLLTFTNYQGVDPEVAYQGGGDRRRNSNVQNGLDYGSYPNAQSFTFGINVGL